MCPHFVCPQMIVAEPGARRGDVHVENLLLGGVYGPVVDDQFRLWDRSRGEEADAGGEVLALAAPSPGKTAGGGKEASVNRPPHMPEQTVPLQSDAEAPAGVLCWMEDDGAVDGEEHLESERQLHLFQPTGDHQRHQSGGSRHPLVVALA